MKKTVIFLMLLSYCVARSIDSGTDIIETSTEPMIPALSDTEVIEENVEESVVPIELDTPDSDIEDGPVNSDQTRLLLDYFKTSTATAVTTTTAATTAATTTVTTTTPQRPFTQRTDLFLIVNSSKVTARKRRGNKTMNSV